MIACLTLEKIIQCLVRPSYSKVLIKRKVFREFIKSLRETCDTLNKEMDAQYGLDMDIPYKELIKLRKQTHCFVSRERFDEKTHPLPHPE